MSLILNERSPAIDAAEQWRGQRSWLEGQEASRSALGQLGKVVAAASSRYGGLTSTGRKLLLLSVLSTILCVGVDLFYFPSGVTFPDESRFLGSAAQLLQDGQFRVGGFRAWEMPGSAAFFAAFLGIGGAKYGILLIRVAQSGLLLLQALLTASIAWHVFRCRTAAFIAAAITMFYPFFVFYQGLLLSESLYVFLLVASLASLYWWRERRAAIDGRLVLTALLFGAAGWIKPTLMCLPPLLVFAAAYSRERPIRRAVLSCAVAAIIYLGSMAPWVVRNYELLGAFVPTTTGASENLYLGNNANNPEGGIDWERNVDPDFVRRANALKEIDRQKIFAQKAQDWIVANPLGFLSVSAKKFIRYWNIIPNAAEYRVGAFSVISALSYGPILLSAIVGMLMWRRQSSLIPVYLLVGYFALVHAVVISSLRYRLPLEPFLIIMGSFALARLLHWVQSLAASRSRMTAAGPAGLSIGSMS